MRERPTKRSDAEITSILRSALRRKYSDSIRYALLEEVANGTGFSGRGWADAVLLELWPSDGLHLLGFEIKASRNDWKNELKKPSKSENVARFCDGWIVVAPVGVVPIETVPATWGLWQYNLDEDTWHYAKKYEPRLQPKYIPRQFFAALLRRAQQSLPAAQYIAHAIAEAQQRTKREMKHDRQSEIREKDHEIDRLTRSLKAAQEALKSAGFEYHWGTWRPKVQAEVANA